MIERDALEPTLPCDVTLPPATVIRKGVKLSTLLLALKVRGMALAPSSPALRGVVEALADVERRWPGSFWHMAKGRVSASEPLFAFQVLFGTDEVLAEGEGDSEVAAIDCALSTQEQGNGTPDRDGSERYLDWNDEGKP